MAKKRKQKAKAPVQKMSPAKVIQSRGRKLEIDKCYVNKDWESSMMAEVLIVRKHTGGTFTIGFYLLDISAMGLKDTFFHFNISSIDVDDILDRVSPLGLEEITYTQAHNMVIQAWEFGVDNGFKTPKEFAVTKYLLEEDSDEIPFVEIPLGEEGVPFYDPEMHDIKVLQTLQKNLDEGEFYNYEDDEYDKEEVRRNLINSLRIRSFYEQLALDAPFDMDKVKEIEEKIHPYLENLSDTGSDINDPFLNGKENSDLIHDLAEVYRSLTEVKLLEFEQKAMKLPHSARLWNNIGLAYLFIGNDQKGFDILEFNLEKSPEYTSGRFFLAYEYLKKNELEKAQKILLNKEHLWDWEIEDRHPSIVAMTLITYFAYYLAKKDYVTSKLYIDSLSLSFFPLRMEYEESENDEQLDLLEDLSERLSDLEGQILTIYSKILGIKKLSDLSEEEFKNLFPEEDQE